MEIFFSSFSEVKYKPSHYSFCQAAWVSQQRRKGDSSPKPTREGLESQRAGKVFFKALEFESETIQG